MFDGRFRSKNYPSNIFSMCVCVSVCVCVEWCISVGVLMYSIDYTVALLLYVPSTLLFLDG